jgi:peptide/nickel transport system permease protein
MQPSFSFSFLVDLVKHAFLPSLSLIIVGTGWWFLSMKALSSTTKSEDYVQYAEAAGIPQSKILFGYVMKNSMLPQFTNLALSLGGVFNGALVTEYFFAYPGIGQTLYMAVTNGDFNLMMGISVFSIFAIASAALVIDLLYPLIDPRVRYR